MKKIINGKRYDTKTATEISSWENTPYSSDFNHYSERLFQKRTGEYFLYGRGGPSSKYSESAGQNQWSGGEQIAALSPEEAREWAEAHMDADDYAEHFPVTPDEPDTAMQTVGANIRKAREAAGMTQTDLAVKISTTQATIFRYESGTQDPSATRVMQLVKALGCTVADIL